MLKLLSNIDASSFPVIEVQIPFEAQHAGVIIGHRGRKLREVTRSMNLISCRVTKLVQGLKWRSIVMLGHDKNALEASRDILVTQLKKIMGCSRYDDMLIEYASWMKMTSTVPTIVSSSCASELESEYPISSSTPSTISSVMTPLTLVESKSLVFSHDVDKVCIMMIL